MDQERKYEMIDISKPEGQAALTEAARFLDRLLADTGLLVFDPDDVAIKTQAANTTGAIARMTFGAARQIAAESAETWLKFGYQMMALQVLSSHEKIAKMVDDDAWRDLFMKVATRSRVLSALMGLHRVLAHFYPDGKADTYLTQNAAYFTLCHVIVSEVPDLHAQVIGGFIMPVGEQLQAAREAGALDEARAEELYQVAVKRLLELAPKTELSELAEKVIGSARSSDVIQDLLSVVGSIMLMANEGVNGFDLALEDIIEQLGTVVTDDGSQTNP